MMHPNGSHTASAIGQSVKHRIKLAAFVVLVGALLTALVGYSMNRKSVTRPSANEDICKLGENAELWRTGPDQFYLAMNGAAVVGPNITYFGFNSKSVYGALGQLEDPAITCFIAERETGKVTVFNDRDRLADLMETGTPYGGLIAPRGLFLPK